MDHGMQVRQQPLALLPRDGEAEGRRCAVDLGDQAVQTGSAGGGGGAEELVEDGAERDGDCVGPGHDVRRGVDGDGAAVDDGGVFLLGVEEVVDKEAGGGFACAGRQCCFSILDQGGGESGKRVGTVPEHIDQPIFGV